MKVSIIKNSINNSILLLSTYVMFNVILFIDPLNNLDGSKQ